MIEREFIKTKIKNLRIKEKIINTISKGAAPGGVTIDKTPLGEKITIDTIRPGLVIGRGGETIKFLTNELKSKFGLENPQIEVREMLKPDLNAHTVARRIADELERFGPSRFKSIGYRTLTNILKSGAMGAEIKIGGRGVPSQRARTWRFYGGYLKKCGDIAVNLIDSAIERADLKSGTVGIQVKIMLPNTPLPDNIIIQKPIKIEPIKEKIIEETEIKEEKSIGKPKESVKEVKEEKKALVKEVKKETKSVVKKPLAKKAPAKKPAAKKAPAKKPAAKKASAKKPAAKKEAKK